jgi:hypothetical protein
VLRQLNAAKRDIKARALYVGSGGDENVYGKERCRQVRGRGRRVTWRGRAEAKRVFRGAYAGSAVTGIPRAALRPSAAT